MALADPFYAVGLPISISDHGSSIEQLFTTPQVPARRRTSVSSEDIPSAPAKLGE